MCMVFALALSAVRDRRSLSPYVFQRRYDTEDRRHGNDHSNQTHAIHYCKRIPSAVATSSPGTAAAKTEQHQDLK